MLQKNHKSEKFNDSPSLSLSHSALFLLHFVFFYSSTIWYPFDSIKIIESVLCNAVQFPISDTLCGCGLVVCRERVINRLSQLTDKAVAVFGKYATSIYSNKSGKSTVPLN